MTTTTPDLEGAIEPRKPMRKSHWMRILLISAIAWSFGAITFTGLAITSEKMALFTAIISILFAPVWLLFYGWFAIPVIVGIVATMWFIYSPRNRTFDCVYIAICMIVGMLPFFFFELGNFIAGPILGALSGMLSGFLIVRLKTALVRSL